MELETTEDRVTKLLSASEILPLEDKKSFVSNPVYDLGRFLKKTKSEPGRFGIKYIFVK